MPKILTPKVMAAALIASPTTPIPAKLANSMRGSLNRRYLKTLVTDSSSRRASRPGRMWSRRNIPPEEIVHQGGQYHDIDGECESGHRDIPYCFLRIELHVADRPISPFGIRRDSNPSKLRHDHESGDRIPPCLGEMTNPSWGSPQTWINFSDVSGRVAASFFRPTAMHGLSLVSIFQFGSMSGSNIPNGAEPRARSRGKIQHRLIG